MARNFGPSFIFGTNFNYEIRADFFFVVGQLHEDASTEEHPGNLIILLS